MIFFKPAPNDLSSDNLRALSTATIDHQGKDYSILLEYITNRFMNSINAHKHKVFFVNCSGTGAIECSLRNLIDSSVRVLVIESGVFGKRMASICRKLTNHLQVVSYNGEGDIYSFLNENVTGKVDILVMVHHETSTGVTSDLFEASNFCKEHNALFFVDAVSSAFCLPTDVESSSVDVLVTSSQKGIEAGAGVGIVCISRAAWSKRLCDSEYYFDWNVMEDSYSDDMQSPWTPSIQLMQSLKCSFQRFEKIGMQNLIDQRVCINSYLKRRLEALGFVYFSQSDPSPPVHVVKPPNGFSCLELIESLELVGVLISPAQKELKEVYVRIALYGRYEVMFAIMLISIIEKLLFVHDNHQSIRCVLSNRVTNILELI